MEIFKKYLIKKENDLKCINLNVNSTEIISNLRILKKIKKIKKNTIEKCDEKMIKFGDSILIKQLFIDSIISISNLYGDEKHDEIIEKIYEIRNEMIAFYKNNNIMTNKFFDDITEKYNKIINTYINDIKNIFIEIIKNCDEMINLYNNNLKEFCKNQHYHLLCYFKSYCQHESCYGVKSVYEKALNFYKQMIEICNSINILIDKI